MSRIFISYRRADSIAITGRIYDRLVETFGSNNVFKDVDNIPPGADFRAIVAREVGACEVLMVIIGQDWSIIADDEGHPRLWDPTDFVRIEVEAGLGRDDMLVIPVLTDYASMPSAKELPDTLQPLIFRNAVSVRHDPDFNHDCSRLIQYLKRYFEVQIDVETQLKQLDEISHSNLWTTMNAALNSIDEKVVGYAPLIARVHAKRDYWKTNYEERSRHMLRTALEESQSLAFAEADVLKLLEAARQLAPTRGVVERDEYLIQDMLRRTNEQRLEIQRKADEDAKAKQSAMPSDSSTSYKGVEIAPNEAQAVSNRKASSLFAYAPELEQNQAGVAPPNYSRSNTSIARYGLLTLLIGVIIVGALWLFQPPPLDTESANTDQPPISTLSPALIANAEVAQVTRNLRKVHGPTNGAVPEADPNSCRFAEATTIRLANFLATVRISGDDTAGVWSRGLFFRDNGNGIPHFRLLLNSTGDWYFILWRDQYYVLQQGHIDYISNGPERTNTLRLVANDNQAWFYVNSIYIATLDLSEHAESGNIKVVTCLDGGNAQRTSQFEYSNFEVYALS